MNGEPAIRKVVLALADVARLVPQVQVFPDRTRADEIDRDERPCIVIRVAEMAFEEGGFEGGQHATLHRVSVDLDFFEEAATFGGISRRHSEMVGHFIKALHADRTLGGMLQECEERSLTSEEDDVPDLGCAVLTIELSFWTPRGDFNTIIGASGLIP